MELRVKNKEESRKIESGFWFMLSYFWFRKWFSLGYFWEFWVLGFSSMFSIIIYWRSFGFFCIVF